MKPLFAREFNVRLRDSYTRTMICLSYCKIRRGKTYYLLGMILSLLMTGTSTINLMFFLAPMNQCTLIEEHTSWFI